MKWVPIKAVGKRLGLTYGQIECDPILKVVRRDKRDYVLSASITCYKKDEMRKKRLAVRLSKVHGSGTVSIPVRARGSNRVIKERKIA